MLRGRAISIMTLALAACPPFPDSGPYRCESDADCAGGLTCVRDVCRTCEPKTCADYPGACGALDDTCGRTIQCGCTAPDTCGGGGDADRCGCTPMSCDDVAPSCGTFDDGCAATITCGCGAHSACSPEGTCRCAPDTCETFGASCDWIADGCGHCASCGTCAPNEVCGLDTPLQCARNPACITAGAECGFAVTGSATSTTPSVYCGHCPNGQACENLHCVPVQRPFCWGPLTRFEASRYRGAWPGVGAVEEHGELWLYGMTDVLAPNDNGCTRHIRMKLDGPTAANLDTAEEVHTSTFDLNIPADELCTRIPQVTCDGWVSRPVVRSDGLEMFFHSSYPCGDWNDNELWLSYRKTAVASWSSPVLIDSITTLLPGTPDSAFDPVLLPDDRTLVFTNGNEVIRAARRPNAEPGNTSFASLDFAFVDDDGLAPNQHAGETGPSAVSCDGEHLIYRRTILADGSPNLMDIRMARILSTDPLVLGVPVEHSPWPDARSQILTVQESPDCSTLFIKSRSVTWYRERVPCP